MTALEAGIVTDDIDGLTRFYVDGLDFTVLSDMQFSAGQVRRLERGDAAIKLFRPSVATSPRPGGEHWHSFRGFSYAALHVHDADAEVTRASAAGGRLIHPVTAHRPGARFALIADPAGNVWEILEETADR
jgi:predicted enzyme related to lactoylglutathione lyase